MVVLGNAKGCCFGVRRVRLLANVRCAQDIEALGIRRHQSVLDTVVDHLDKMTGAALPAVEIAVLGGARGGVLSSRGARDIAETGSEGLEDRIQPLHGLVRAADHHAVAALETPHAAAGADV